MNATPRVLGDRINRALLRSGMLELAWLIRLCAAALRTFRFMRGDAKAQDLWHRVAALAIWSGWPFSPGWVNLHVSRFYAAVERAVWGSPAITARPVVVHSGRRLRIGMLAHFHLTLGAQRPLFEAMPKNIELHLFDRFPGGADYLAPLVDGYHSLMSDDPAVIARAINAADLDMFLNMIPKSLAYRVFELIDVPCVVHVGTGSDLMHHPRVSFHLFTQPEFGYEVRDRQVFCTFIGQPFGSELAYSSSLVCDTRNLNTPPPKPWRDREPLIVWHGSLYKLGSRPFLGAIFDLLVQNGEARFEFFGKGAPEVLDTIYRHADLRGVRRRVAHRGVAGFARDRQGSLQPETFMDLRDALRRARLWPDSFPIGGGSARFEAYSAGVPSVHMAPATDDPEGPYEDGSLLELPWLRTAGSVARSRSEYVEMATRCLRSEPFATSLISAQNAVVTRVSDASAWWTGVVRCHEDWEQRARA